MKQTRRSSFPNWVWGMWLQGDEAAVMWRFYLQASVCSHLGTKPNDPSVMLFCCLHCFELLSYLHSQQEETGGFGFLWLLLWLSLLNGSGFASCSAVEQVSVSKVLAWFARYEVENAESATALQNIKFGGAVFVTSIQTETGRKLKDCVFLALAGVMCITNNVLNLHLRISEGHELNTHLCEVRQELLPCYESWKQGAKIIWVSSAFTRRLKQFGRRVTGNLPVFRLCIMTKPDFLKKCSAEHSVRFHCLHVGHLGSYWRMHFYNEIGHTAILLGNIGC